jgi:CRP/FNR family cyclic AMP-dependent transcriptional regulator
MVKPPCSWHDVGVMMRGEIEWEFSEGDDGAACFMATNRAIQLIRQHLSKGEIEIALSLYESCAENVGDELLEELDTASSHLQKALANLFYRARDYHRAGTTCIRLGQWAHAAKSFEAGGYYAEAAGAFIRADMTDSAATNFEKAGQTDKAIELHQQNKAFDKAALVAASAGDALGAARLWAGTGNRKAASRCLSSVPSNQEGFDEAASMLDQMKRDRTPTVIEETLPPAATEAEVRAYTGELKAVDPVDPVDPAEALDPFEALDGNVFQRKTPQSRAASISNIDQFGRKAAARYVTRMEGYDSLKRLPLFDGLSMDELKDVYHLGSQIEFAPGEVLIPQGRPGKALYIIRSGRVSVCVVHGDQETQLAELEKDAFVGEMSLIDESPTSAKVVAKEACIAFVLSRSALSAYMLRHDHVALRIYKSFAKTLAHRLRLATKQSLAAHI